MASDEARVEEDIIELEKGKVLHILEQSKDAVEREHSLSMLDGIRLYPKIIAWSMLISLPVVGVQIDETIMGALYALPAFQKRYGYEYNGKYIIPAQWQAAIGMSGYIGQILGGIGAIITH